MQTFKHQTTPLFVNSSQMHKYGCSPHVSTAAISDESADCWNIFRRFSASPSMDVAAEQSSRNCANDTESYTKPEYDRYVSTPVSPIFNRHILQHTLATGQNSLKDDSVRTVKKDSAFTAQIQHRSKPVDVSSKSSSLLNAEDRDCASPLFTVPSRKRRRRQVHPVIDSDSSDSDSEVCKSTSSDRSVYNKSRHNGAVPESSIHRLSTLEHRHCFDPLLSCEPPDVVKNSDIVQCLPRGHSEHLQRNDDVCRQSVRSSSQSPSVSFDRKIAEKSDIAGEVGISSVSSPCCVQLSRLQLHDVPSSILLSQEDKFALSHRCSSAVGDQTSAVSSDNELQTSNNFTHPTDSDVNCGNAVQSSFVHYDSSEDLFSDDELIESVCLSQSLYCNSGKGKDDAECDVFKPSESAVTCEQSEAPSVHYSQVEDDCILISDSDDDLFANLTQSDILVKVEDGRQSDESDGTDDDNWLQDDADSVAAAGSSDHDGEMPVKLEKCDPWIDDVADVSSDELEEAYNAALSSAVPAKGCDFVSTCIAAASQRCHISDDSAVTSVNALSQSSTCSVVLKPLRLSDIPPDVRLPVEQKHVCERDGDGDGVDDDATDSDSHSDMFSEDVAIKSMSCKVKPDAKCSDDDKAVTAAVDMCRKPDMVLKSSDLTGFADSGKLACSGTSAKPDSSAAVVDVSHQTSSSCGTFKKMNKLSPVCDTGEVVENVDIKHMYDKKSTSARMALEDCIEVAEFYGTSMTVTSKENRWQKKKMKTVTDVDKVTDAKSVKKDEPHSTVTAPSRMKSQKLDSVKPEDDSACKEEEWKCKSSMKPIDVHSVHYQKITQMRDCNKQKLRKDRTSTSSGRGLQTDDNNDLFQGLSQFSVAKQQLVERNRQLKTNGLCYVICQLQNLSKISLVTNNNPIYDYHTFSVGL